MKQVHAVIFQRWKGEEVIDLVGPGGMQIWVKFRPEELQHGGYNVAIDPDSTLPETKQMREAKAVQVYQLLASNSMIDKHKLTNYLLRQLHGSEFDDMLVGPDQAAAMQAQAMQFMEGQGTSPQNPMTRQQYTRASPGLRAIAGGRTPQR